MGRRKSAAERLEEAKETPFGPSEHLRTRKIKLREVAEVLEERGLEPIGAICDVLPNLDYSMQARTLLALAEFVHPKLGRTEVTGKGGGPVEVVGMTKEQRDAAVAAAARADS